MAVLVILFVIACIACGYYSLPRTTWDNSLFKLAILPKYVISDHHNRVYFNEFKYGGIYQHHRVEDKTSVCIPRKQAKNIQPSIQDPRDSWIIEQSNNQSDHPLQVDDSKLYDITNEQRITDDLSLEIVFLSDNTGDMAFHGNMKKLFIVDTGGNKVLFMDTDTNKLYPYAGNGQALYNGDNMPALSASLCSPIGLAFDSRNHLFISDSCNYRIRRVDAKTRMIDTYIGSGSQRLSNKPSPFLENFFAVQLFNPRSIAFDQSDNLLIIDDNSILEADLASKQLRVKITCSETDEMNPGSHHNRSIIHDLAVDSSNSILFLDLLNHSIWKVEENSSLSYAVEYAGNRQAVTNFGMMFDSLVTIDTETLSPRQLKSSFHTSSKFFIDNENHSKKFGRFHLQATYATITTGSIDGEHICIDPSGNVYVGKFGSPLTYMIPGSLMHLYLPS
jgi:hypothetical protein